MKQEPYEQPNSPNTQQKTVISQLLTTGKQKIKNETSCTNSSQSYVCDKGKSIKGYIHTCDNYQQMKDCALADELIVGVPAGDQAYHENIKTEHEDSCAEIQCNVCHNMSNQTLLLQCDLCDSSSHTYCVGLGDTVPEDDWICQNCTEHAEDEQDLKAVGLSGIDSHSGSKNRCHQNVSSTEANLSIHDIVRESGPYNVERSLPNQSRSPLTNAGDDRTVLISCRNRDSRTRALRENWDKIRQGSLSFSSFPIIKPGELSCGTSSATKSSTSDIIPDQATQDIKKAWKMMKAAKSVEKKKYTNTIPCPSNGSKHPLTNTETPKHFPSVRSMLPSTRHSGDKDKDCKNLKRPFQGCATEKCHDKPQFPKFQKENPSSFRNFEHHPTTYSAESSNFSTKTGQFSVHARIDDESSVNLQTNRSLGSLANANKIHSSSDCSVSLRSVAKPLAAAKQNVHATAPFNVNKVTNVEEHQVDGQAKVLSDAKSEIQTLVKLNLKLSNAQKKLATNEFKEVARHATYSILAACGIGIPKPWVRPFSNPHCSHADKVDGARRSTLMPSSCRECFMAFVKDVVDTVLLEKTS
ncbi:hypothetical protein DCAR_0311512 [Daucus carota subsp. sativus]|uniref:PHD-type domain-containing protein n=1 Tax=Daucus carota subsp. sativus TaxID=79200 RepID=A0AAF1AR00_DAUCS|nr:hypothetical protein DCAR_0311512 [Daucus carota subsp. sativus]